MNDRVHNRVTRPPPPHRRAAAKNRACRKLIIVSLAVVAIAARQFHFTMMISSVSWISNDRKGTKFYLLFDYRKVRLFSYVDLYFEIVIFNQNASFKMGIFMKRICGFAKESQRRIFFKKQS